MSVNLPIKVETGESAAKYLIEQARQRGVVLMQHANDLHAYPPQSLKKHPILLKLIKVHLKSIIKVLHDVVE